MYTPRPRGTNRRRPGGGRPGTEVVRRRTDTTPEEVFPVHERSGVGCGRSGSHGSVLSLVGKILGVFATFVTKRSRRNLRLFSEKIFGNGVRHTPFSFFFFFLVESLILGTM